MVRYKNKRVTRAGIILPKVPKMGVQLVDRPDPTDRSSEDVNGQPLSEDEKTWRIALLAQSLQIRIALAGADPEDQAEIIAQAAKLVERFCFLKSSDANDAAKREAFLCITCSGMVQECVGAALKAIEEWDDRYSDPIVRSAEAFLTARMLEGVRNVSAEDRTRCKQFVKKYMTYHQAKMPKSREFDEVLDTVVEKWEWYLEANKDRCGYYARFTVESLKEEMAKKIGGVYQDSPDYGRFVVQKLEAALDSIRDQEEAELLQDHVSAGSNRSEEEEMLNNSP